MKNDICKMLDIKYPIFQGGMAWVSDSSLASAVSNAGGLGIIAGATAPVDYIREEIRKTKKLTDKPFGLNIMLLSDNAEELAKIAVEEGVKVITTGAGNPGKYMSMWKEAGIKVIPVVPSVALAKRMERAGADAVIAEGCESGGHVGKLTTMVLVPQVVDAVNIPVIAAGGICDGRGITAAFALGARGIQMGTRFLVSDECTIHENYKNAVIKAKDIDTVVTGRVTGHPVQVIKNRLAREFLKLEASNVSAEKLEELGRGALRRAVKDGDVDNSSLMAGQISGMVSKKQSVKEIIEEIFNEYEELRKAL
ncbi:enoyl-[acyl-carrier-protein] reductase FabK [Clostridium sp. NSJ-49]|uniref:Probable nitronate monooxygenase n=1 Tax=Clostridium disporicum TaxID=84024 RepID=A0A173Z474_9CLOT|nr:MULTISPECIES: enoyl-[acyl-carrier-protein] reductase FabK [Clostridium]MBC5623950.1 enoyl-[acyl-carrier-protein] reductase FabK [Clostridium sp. NSJ-49]MCD2502630.1 enoyl-[acyl-carrier-protein] reductase FabK [Clostridium sp. NSJ-145]CUN70530.1 2-nitropropane dioxygenase [Clostridium disporicum]